MDFQIKLNKLDTNVIFGNAIISTIPKASLSFLLTFSKIIIFFITYYIIRFENYIFSIYCINQNFFKEL